MKKELLKELPEEVANEVLETLVWFTGCSVTYENGKFHVLNGVMLTAQKAPDYKYYGYFKNSDIYTKEELKANLEKVSDWYRQNELKNRDNA